MLDYLDPYPRSAEIKGAFTPARWRYVFILSNRHPDDWYYDDGKIVKGDDPIVRKESRINWLSALKRKIGLEPANGRCLLLPCKIYENPKLVEAQRVAAEKQWRDYLDKQDLDYNSWGAMEEELPDDVAEWRRDHPDKTKRSAAEITASPVHASLDHASPDLALVPAIPDLDKSPILGPNGSPPGYSHNNAAQIANDKDGHIYLGAGGKLTYC
jgi:hypothetical protein